MILRITLAVLGYGAFTIISGAVMLTLAAFAIGIFDLG